MAGVLLRGIGEEEFAADEAAVGLLEEAQEHPDPRGCRLDVVVEEQQHAAGGGGERLCSSWPGS